MKVYSPPSFRSAYSLMRSDSTQATTPVDTSSGNVPSSSQLTAQLQGLGNFTQQTSAPDDSSKWNPWPPIVVFGVLLLCERGLFTLREKNPKK